MKISHRPRKLCLALRPRATFSGMMEKIIALLHYSVALQNCLVTYLLAQIFCFSVVLKNSHSMMTTQRFCHCDCWKINNNWTDTQCWIYLIFCIWWLLHPVWERERGGVLRLIHLRIIKSNFAWIFFSFGKINSKKFKQVKSQEENNGISKERSKTVCCCTKREK